MEAVDYRLKLNPRHWLLVGGEHHGQTRRAYDGAFVRIREALGDNVIGLFDYMASRHVQGGCLYCVGTYYSATPEQVADIPRLITETKLAPIAGPERGS